MKKQPSYQSSKVLYRRILRYSLYYWPAMLLGILGNALNSGVDAGATYLLKPIINKGFIAKDFVFIHWLPALVCGIFLLRAVTDYVGSYYMTFVARSVVKRLRQDIFNHLLKIPATYYDNSSSGQILSIMLYNVEQVARVGADSLTDLIQSFFFVIGLLIVMFSVSWKLSLIYFITVPLIAVSVKLTTKLVRKINHAIQKGMGKITTIAEESIEGYKVVRAFGGEAYERNKFDLALEDNRRRELHNVVVKTLSSSVVQLIASAALAIIVYLATAEQSTTLSAGSFVTLVASMLAILKPLKTFSSVNSSIQRGVAAAQGVFALLDDVVEVDQGQQTLARATGKIVYEGVDFTYPGTQKPVLKNIDFTLLPGKTLAIVGRSGSGKSTLVSLLPRFYDIAQGRILLDDQSIAEYTLADLRKQIAIVSQGITLFNDTVARNIAYGLQNDASETAIIDAAKAAHAW